MGGEDGSSIFVVPQDCLKMTLPSLLSAAAVIPDMRFLLTASPKAWFSRAVVSVPGPLWLL